MVEMEKNLLIYTMLKRSLIKQTAKPSSFSLGSVNLSETFWDDAAKTTRNTHTHAPSCAHRLLLFITAACGFRLKHGSAVQASTSTANPPRDANVQLIFIALEKSYTEQGHV